MVCYGNTSCATTTGAAPQLFASAINFLAATQCFVPDNEYQNIEDNETYDFIIVGGGSAGSVVANRLSEINDWKVLLLEAGSVPPIESDIPGFYGTLFQTKYDWNYNTRNDGVRHQAFRSGNVYWPRAKMLGGSSAMNAMIYIRGRDDDFESWVKAGNPSWTPERANFYFRKAESYQNIEALKDFNVRRTYGTDGPQVVNKFNSTNRDVVNKVLESWDHMGFRRVKDVNAAKFSGLGLSSIFSVSAANGVRYSTYQSYVEPFKSRKNLKVVTNAFVTKILINNHNQAHGIQLDIFGEKRTIYAKKEIIISAGAINTPQLLMLSGIGPREHLLSKNISCKVDLPGVGKNLHDHSSIFIPVYGDEPGEANPEEQLFEAVKYMYNKSGALATGAFTDITAFFSRKYGMSYPEFQTHLSIINKNSSSFQTFITGYQEDTRNSLLELSTTKSLFAFAFHLLHPTSRGSIYLNTSNAYDHPIIDANYYGDKNDLQITAEGIMMLTKIVKTPYFRSINAVVPRANISQCNQYEFESESYWKCYALQATGTIYHPVGTAKMGPDPKDAVVSNFLKVHGVKGLRVIDASVMPTVTSGNTNAPTIMIGEMGSDMIKTEHLTGYNMK